jgi:hypothetical protein
VPAAWARDRGGRPGRKIECGKGCRTRELRVWRIRHAQKGQRQVCRLAALHTGDDSAPEPFVLLPVAAIASGIQKIPRHADKIGCQLHEALEGPGCFGEALHREERNPPIGERFGKPRMECQRVVETAQCLRHALQVEQREAAVIEGERIRGLQGERLLERLERASGSLETAQRVPLVVECRWEIRPQLERPAIILDGLDMRAKLLQRIAAKEPGFGAIGLHADEHVAAIERGARFMCIQQRACQTHAHVPLRTVDRDGFP